MSVKDKSEEPHARRANVISLLALLFSIASIVFTTWQYFDSRRIIQLDHESRVSVRIDPLYYSHVTFVSDATHPDGQYYKKQFKVILSNNGYHRTSIVDWDLTLAIDIGIDKLGKTKTLRMFVPSLNPALLNEKGEPFLLPKDIEPGSSISFFLEVNIGVSKKTWNSLKTNFSLSNPVPWSQVEGYLLNGNRMVNDMETLEFLLRFVKAEGQDFEGRFTVYGNYGMLQGEKLPSVTTDVR